MSEFASIEEIKQAVSDGATIGWRNAGYQVRQGALGWEVVATFNGSSDPLNAADYNAADFFTVLP
jgi:hypothetical protein